VSYIQRYCHRWPSLSRPACKNSNCNRVSFVNVRFQLSAPGHRIIHVPKSRLDRSSKYSKDILNLEIQYLQLWPCDQDYSHKRSQLIHNSTLSPRLVTTVQYYWKRRVHDTSDAEYSRCASSIGVVVVGHKISLENSENLPFRVVAIFSNRPTQRRQRQ